MAKSLKYKSEVGASLTLEPFIRKAVELQFKTAGSPTPSYEILACMFPAERQKVAMRIKNVLFID
jgi:hypothetical protein